MRYEKMFPWQIREAIQKNIPLVIPMGVLEYHAEHLTVGVDAHVVRGAIDLLEKEHPEMIVFPTFYLGTPSYAVAGPEGNGSVEIDSKVVSAVCEQMFTSLLEIGFRNIHGFSFHQGENFDQGMPTDLAFRFAARRMIFAFLEKTKGRGWWGDESMANYYECSNPFDWIQIHPIANPGKPFPGDHAGPLETSLMMYLYPDEVDMAHHSDKMWYAREAPGHSSAEYGKQVVDSYVENMRNILFGLNPH